MIHPLKDGAERIADIARQEIAGNLPLAFGQQLVAKSPAFQLNEDLLRWRGFLDQIVPGTQRANIGAQFRKDRAIGFPQIRCFA